MNALCRRLGIAAICVLVPSAWAEEAVKLDQVPKAVMDAVKKRFPKAVPTEAAKELENEKTVYEVTFKEAGKNVDVTLTPEGTIILIEKQIEMKDIPKAVKSGVEKKYPGATYKLAEQIFKVEEGKERLAYFEVLVETQQKKRMEIEVTPEGKIQKEEADEDDDGEKVEKDKKKEATKESTKSAG